MAYATEEILRLGKELEAEQAAHEATKRELAVLKERLKNSVVAIFGSTTGPFYGKKARIVMEDS